MRRFALAQQGNSAGGVVVGVDPLESGGFVIQLMQGGFAAVKAVQLLHPCLNAAMHLILQHVPFEAGIVVPLAYLAELVAHEEQLLAGLGVHVAEEQPQIGELLPVVARHLAEQRALAVHDLVVRERQHEILVKGVEHAERELVVVVLAVNRILLKVLRACRASSPCPT